MQKQLLSLLLALFFLGGCATLHPGWEKPAVGLTSIRILPSNGILPRFEIGLQVLNPNRTPLPLEGIVYSVSLNNNKILTGVANDLPTVKEYGQEELKLVSGINLGGSIKLFNQLLSSGKSSFTYTFTAKIDTGRFSPTLHFKEEGTLNSALSLDTK
ncbi:LEA type 2 family protein [Desulforhopalus vacuolatus]|uniref:LEA type 2 family protein n=1 Tax=Desulforhopalus vacuolatus TaxID=40414 RepID=UPI0019650DE5|nr:LEA type 2 family protein [Desulforhopalus vacuolatus]MBM9519454.1 LEA type 2 family protein [Desulforhopalus vacuolatus]